MNEKLTAYALNELPPDERAALEAQIQKDPALRQQADEMKTFCSLLNEQIVRSDSDTLKPEQRTQLLENFQSTPKVIRPFWRRPAFIGVISLAAAACVALMFTAHQINQQDHEDLNALVLGADSLSPELPSLEVKEVVKRSEAKSGAKPMLLAQDNSSSDSGTPITRVAPPPLSSIFSNAKGDDLRGASGLSAPSTISTSAIAYHSSADKDRDLSIDGITKSGSGTLTLSGGNTYTGSTSVTGGFLIMDAGKSSPTFTTPDQRGGSILDLAATSAPKPMLMADAAMKSTLRSSTETSRENLEPAAAPSSPEHPSESTAEKFKPLAVTQKKGVSVGGKSDAPATIASSSAITAQGQTDKDVAVGKLQPSGLPSVKGLALEETSALGGSSSSTTPPMSGFGSGSGMGGGGFNALAPSSNSEREKSLYYAAARDHTRTKMLDDIAMNWEDKAPPIGDIPVTGGLFGRQSAANGTQTYRPIIENPFLYVAQQPLSTFSLDVDTASYANVRRMLNSHQRPPANAVRLEELINYFPYSYEGPTDDKPFAVHVDIAEAPWQPLHRLARVAVKGREIKGERQPANFVFLLDVSGSMQPEERLPLIKQSLRLLVDQLRADDRVAIVTYAGESGVALPATAGSKKEKITQAIDHLRAGGSTNGASGIRLAYEQAALNFSKERINRVILATDGDFNVGTSSVQELEKLIAEKAKGGVFLSVLGVGTDNLHDHTMQAIADRGNGNYHYLDSLGEARKVLVEQMTGTLVTIAKDVKVQIEFNPAQVAAYRLIGYEKRLLGKEDFNNDKKDAGEIGAGHTITALYEIVPASLKYPDGKPAVDDLKYAQNSTSGAKAQSAKPIDEAAPAELKPQAPSNETITVKLRYKQPDGDTSQLIEIPFTDNEKKLADSDKEFQFAVSVAGFGMLLRDSQHTSELSWEMVRKLALSGKGPDEQGWRGEFIQLIEKARGLSEK